MIHWMPVNVHTSRNGSGAGVPGGGGGGRKDNLEKVDLKLAAKSLKKKRHVQIQAS